MFCVRRHPNQIFSARSESVFQGGVAQVDRVLYNTSDEDSSSRRDVDTVYLGDVLTHPIILEPYPKTFIPASTLGKARVGAFTESNRNLSES